MAEGIKETKEGVVGAMILAGIIAKEMKNGFQFPADLIAMFAAIQGDAEKKAKLDAAVDAINKVPAEVSDISMAEGIELATAVVQELPALIESFKK